MYIMVFLVGVIVGFIICAIIWLYKFFPLHVKMWSDCVKMRITMNEQGKEMIDIKKKLQMAFIEGFKVSKKSSGELYPYDEWTDEMIWEDLKEKFEKVKDKLFK